MDDKTSKLIFWVIILVIIVVSLSFILPSNSNNEEKKNEKNLNNNYLIDTSNITLVGDSRTDMLCAYSWYKSDSGTCIAESGMGYNWLLSTAIPRVNRLSSDKKKYIATNLGVNGLTENSVNQYISKYKELADGDWKDSMIFLISVNPTKGKYEHMNANIDNFNQKLNEAFKNYKNVIFCDTNSYLKKIGFNSNDGLHYTEATSKIIYDQIKKCIYDYYN